MTAGLFSNAALVLVGHGSTKCEDSAAPVYQHAAEIRRRRIFAEVVEAFWKIDPFVKDALKTIQADSIFVAPLFISDGYFSEEAIPLALGLRREAEDGFERAQRVDGKTLHYCRAVGTDQRMTEAILARVNGVVAQFPFPRQPRPEEITLCIAGHGTMKNENSRSAVEAQVREIRKRGIFADVHAIFMMEPPLIGECYRIAATKNLVVVPFFISDGQHVTEDIPVMLGQPEREVRDRRSAGLTTWRNPTERKGRRVWYTASVGTEPLVADVILERVKQAARIRCPNGSSKSDCVTVQ